MYAQGNKDWDKCLKHITTFLTGRIPSLKIHYFFSIQVYLHFIELEPHNQNRETTLEAENDISDSLCKEPRYFMIVKYKITNVMNRKIDFFNEHLVSILFCC